MTDRELMQQALEALKTLMIERGSVYHKAIIALRERLAREEQKTCLVANESCKHGSWCSEVYCQEHCKFVEQSAQPEQEPVAWRWKERINNDFDSWVVTFSEPPPYAVEQQPLYTEPPKREWVGLTDKQIFEIWEEAMVKDNGKYARLDNQPFVHFARAIERAHGIKEKNHG